VETTAATGAGTDSRVSITGKRQNTARTKSCRAAQPKTQNPKPRTQNPPRPAPSTPSPCDADFRSNPSTLQRFNDSTDRTASRRKAPLPVSRPGDRVRLARPFRRLAEKLTHHVSFSAFQHFSISAFQRFSFSLKTPCKIPQPEYTSENMERTPHSGSRRRLQLASVLSRLLRAMRLAVQCASRKCNLQSRFPEPEIVAILIWQQFQQIACRSLNCSTK
jgi:hypothetical protein